MSIQAVAWALEQDLPARPKLVLVSICNHANHVDGYCWLKAETIASEASCSQRGVFNFVGDLIRNGYIRKSLRRGDDGKQRANDYWVALDRPEGPWVKRGPGDAEEADADPLPDDAEPQDVVDGMHGVHAADDVENAPPEPVDKHALACGPHAPACMHRDAEPSKINPKARSAREAVNDAATRRYRPPPPQAMGADLEHKTAPVFVFDGTRAYDAWAVVMARKAGIRSWHLTTRAFIDGKWRSGWYFPTLFPPETATAAATGPPDSNLTESDLQEFK